MSSPSANRRVIRAMIVAAMYANPIAAQNIATYKFGSVNATASEEFTRISGMRELNDGRLIVSESGVDSRVVVLDFVRGSVETLGRRGSGPGEFQNASSLFALGGDSTLLVAGQRRFLILHNATIVSTSRPDDPAVRTAGVMKGADWQGTLLSAMPGSWRDDSLSWQLIQRSSARIISAIHLALGPEPSYPPKPSLRGKTVTYGQYPWSATESAALFSDGWLAVARLHPYRVDWRSPDGKWTLGEPLPIPVIKVDDREKKWYLERSFRFGNAGGRAQQIAVWPKNIPPIAHTEFGILTTPEGMIVVPRTPSADHREARYDVIDRRGRIHAQIVLAPDEELGHIGVRFAHVVFTDDDGIKHIRRYPWPIESATRDVKR